jgi:hypothetical protein
MQMGLRSFPLSAQPNSFNIRLIKTIHLIKNFNLVRAAGPDAVHAFCDSSSGRLQTNSFSKLMEQAVNDHRCGRADTPGTLLIIAANEVASREAV